LRAICQVYFTKSVTLAQERFSVVLWPVLLVLLLGALLVSAIGVNAAGVTGVRTPPIFDLQGYTNALDPCNNCYTITTGGRERKERKGRTPPIS